MIHIPCHNESKQPPLFLEEPGTNETPTQKHDDVAQKMVICIYTQYINEQKNLLNETCEL